MDARDTIADRDTILSVTAWEDQLCRISRRLHEIQPAAATDLLSDAKSGISDEESFLECVVGRVSLETIDFAVESARCLSVGSEDDDPSDRCCVYPGVYPELGGE